MNQPFRLQALPLPDLKLMTREPFRDKRGYLQRLYCKDLLIQAGIDETIMQINHTLTRMKGSIRGMHFQYPPAEEVKVVTCLKGAVFDVAVDLRQKSPTFLQWYSVILSAELHNSLIIPKGFAHGFQSLEDDCELLYFHTASYHPQAEGGLSPLDAILNIRWPLPMSEISDRDQNHTPLTSDFKGL